MQYNADQQFVRGADPVVIYAFAVWIRDGLRNILRIHHIVFGEYAQFVQHIDRKSTRLNSSHQIISYAVFCLKKKKKTKNTFHLTKKKKKRPTQHKHKQKI